MAELKRKRLAKKAEENTTITKKVGREEAETIKSGTPLDHTAKHDPKHSAVVGMSKGVTKNMDNFESLRVDVWLSDTVQDGETAEEAMMRVEAFLDEALEKAVMNTIGE